MAKNKSAHKSAAMHVKRATAKAMTPPPQHDTSDVAGIFAALKTPRRVTATSARNEAHAAAPTRDEGVVRRKRDGLYHAPEKSVTMSDDEFFGRTPARGGGGGAADTHADKAVAAAAGVNRIVSMKQLRRMLSSSARAGTTPNCPFDCDCCF